MSITLMLSSKEDECVDEEVINRLFPLVYQDLRKIANRQLQQAWGVDTLCATSLVNEVYLKLSAQESIPAQNRIQFYGIAASAMRQIVINYAEKKKPINEAGIGCG